MKTLYINQALVTNADGSSEGWEDCCIGHDSMYDAIACKENFIAQSKTRPKEIRDAAPPSIRRIMDQLNMLDIKYKFRILKRTDEVME